MHFLCLLLLIKKSPLSFSIPKFCFYKLLLTPENLNVFFWLFDKIDTVFQLFSREFLGFTDRNRYLLAIPISPFIYPFICRVVSFIAFASLVFRGMWASLLAYLFYHFNNKLIFNVNIDVNTINMNWKYYFAIIFFILFDLNRYWEELIEMNIIFIFFYIDTLGWQKSKNEILLQYKVYIDLNQIKLVKHWKNHLIT